MGKIKVSGFVVKKDLELVFYPKCKVYMKKERDYLANSTLDDEETTKLANKMEKKYGKKIDEKFEDLLSGDLVEEFTMEFDEKDFSKTKKCHTGKELVKRVYYARNNRKYDWWSWQKRR